MNPCCTRARAPQAMSSHPLLADRGTSATILESWSQSSSCTQPQSSVEHYHNAPAIRQPGAGKKWPREGETIDRWQDMRGIAKQLLCTCVLNMEDDCNKKLSGWEGCRVNLPAHHCTRLQSTTTAALTDSTSGISHEHNSNNSQCSKSNSKHQPRALSTTCIPDIPFNVTEISSNGCYRGLENSSAHIEHYLSSYTYPHLEHMLEESLRVKRRVLCSTCFVAEASRLHDKGKVKLRQGVIDGSTHYRNSHLPYKRHRSIPQVYLHIIHVRMYYINKYSLGFQTFPIMCITCSLQRMYST